MTLPGFVTCPTCGGSGEIHQRNANGSFESASWPYSRFCPDCVAGQVPSPETVERMARAAFQERAEAYALPGTWDDTDHRDGWRQSQRAALLEYARHVQEGEK